MKCPNGNISRDISDKLKNQRVQIDTVSFMSIIKDKGLTSTQVKSALELYIMSLMTSSKIYLPPIDLARPQTIVLGIQNFRRVKFEFS